MGDYTQYNPWADAARTSAGFSDPIFEAFAQVPRLRAELAMHTQRLALQAREQDRMDTMTAAQLPHIKSETENQLSQAAYHRAAMEAQQAKIGQVQQGQDMAQRIMRLSSLQGLPDADLATEVLNSPTLHPDLQASGLSNPPEMPELDALRQIISSVLSGNQQGVVAQSPSAMERMIRPSADKTALPFSLPPGHTRYNSDGTPVVTAPGNPMKNPDPTVQFSHLTTGLQKLADNGLDFNKVVSGGVTNTVPTPAYSYATNALANLPQAGQPMQSASQPISAATTRPGQVYKGYRFKGGDWKDKNNWEAQ